MQHLEVSCAVRRLYKSLGVKGLILDCYKGQPVNLNYPTKHYHKH